MVMGSSWNAGWIGSIGFVVYHPSGPVEMMPVRLPLKTLRDGVGLALGEPDRVADMSAAQRCASIARREL
jgi:hypothetical protein